MDNPLILLVGQSGSGKTTIANYLESAKGYKQIQSYTTRKPRYEGETGHTFVTQEDFDNLGELVAYTEYNGNEYGVTAEMINESNLYVIDVPGVKTLLEKYKDNNRPIYVFYFESTVATRIERMWERGDHDTAILSRLHNDEKYDWFERLKNITFDLGKRMGKNIRLHVIDANKDQKDVVGQVLQHLRY